MKKSFCESATFGDDLKWYLASYCSVKAGHAFVTGNYAEAVPYYLAFFGLAQEADSVWPRIQRLVNPMSSYFFAIAGKQLNEPVPPNLVDPGSENAGPLQLDGSRQFGRRFQVGSQIAF